MLRKKEVFTVVTPIPGFIPRQLAIDILHSHSEVITLNPLVLSHTAIPAPQTAAADEFYSTWYEITERIQFVPGVGRMGAGKISFTGCFHDMPWGLQTHIYAPMSVDLRNKYRIAGNQPGEPPEPKEIGLENLGAPKDGLYLREDIEIKCNLTMVSFVKSQMKAASKEMVQRIIKKAELLDAGVLQGMMENGRLKTINPNDRSQLSGTAASRTSSPHMSFAQPHQTPMPQYQRPGTAGSHYGPPVQQWAQYNPATFQQQYGYNNNNMPQYLPDKQQQQQQQQQQYPMELPGDFRYANQPSPGLQPSQPSPGLQPSPRLQSRLSHGSYGSRGPSPRSSAGDLRWSQSQPSPPPGSAEHYRTSMSSVTSSTGGFASPGLPPQQGYTAELPAHKEAPEEYQGRQTEFSMHARVP
ncbi:hypothetical protein S40288_06046 [Stachybotrys chartarum IBT 40288]|nr:hypothetical protein S40288_06046 [Stachybotrys chartarum IBT 40288]